MGAGSSSCLAAPQHSTTSYSRLCAPDRLVPLHSFSFRAHRHNCPFASARTMVCPHQGRTLHGRPRQATSMARRATSRFSTSSSQCRLTSCAAFPSTASDVLDARPRCSRADPPAAAALQLLPHRARPPCTPTWSRPELAQRGHRHALHAVVLHAVLLRSYSSSCCRTRARPGLAAPPLLTPHEPQLPRRLKPRPLARLRREPPSRLRLLTPRLRCQPLAPARRCPKQQREGGRGSPQKKRRRWGKETLGRGRIEREEKQRRRRKGISQGLVRKFRKLQGSLGKVKFHINLKP
jgi:hypothetical protein